MTPSITTFSTEFDRPVPVANGADFRNGWVAPNGVTFYCDYAAHSGWAEYVITHWPDMLEQYKSHQYTKVCPYDAMNALYKKKWNFEYNLEYEDYMVSQGWLKWNMQECGIGNYSVVKAERMELTKQQMDRLEWLCLHLGCNYKVSQADV